MTLAPNAVSLGARGALVPAAHEVQETWPGRAVFDEAYRRLTNGDIGRMSDVAVTLSRVRHMLPPAEWRAYIDEHVRTHPVFPLLQRDPFTHRAFAKPRGYAGDAPMLDLVYAGASPHGIVADLGDELHEWATAQPACCSVRWRRDHLADLIDQVAAERPGARIMSIACGHLREAQRAASVRAGHLAEFIALDQDAQSLALVEQEQRRFNVSPTKGSIKRLLARPELFGQFDFVYSAGLYDYLADNIACALTTSMFRALKPGGRLLVANFAPGMRDIAYMEAVMDWWLIYRDESEVARFVDKIDPSQIAERSMYRDDPGNVVYLTVRKGG